MMKNTLFLLITIGLLSLSSCKQDTNTQALLENTQTRTEIFNAISENHEYMSAFMKQMQDNPHAVQMMQGNKKMMGNMMKGQGMKMMMKDSMMMKNMMQGMMEHMQGRHTMMQEMMKDGKMMGNMMQMMHKKGMMSEDCMQSCMKMMGDKGMDMEGMNKMGSSEKDDHTTHH